MRLQWNIVSPILAAMLICVCASPSPASPTVALRVEDFDYFWDFESGLLDPSDALSFDLYNNATGAAGGDGVADFLLNAGAQPTLDGGVLTIPAGSNVLAQLWPAVPGLGTTSGYTVEYRVRASATTGLGVSMYESPSGTNNIGGLSLFNNGPTTDIYYGMDTVGQSDRLRATLPSDEFVDLRVAVEHVPPAHAVLSGTHRYTIFINGKRAGTGLAPSRAISGIDRLVFGDLGASHDGILELDSIGFTAGAYSPGRTNHPRATPFQLGSTANNAVVRPSDGALMTVVRSSGPEGGTRTSFLVSQDDGASWQNIAVMGTGHGQPGEIGAGMLHQIDADNYVYVYRDPNSFSPAWDHANNVPLATASFDMWSIRSDDGGVSWRDQQKVLDGYTGAFINMIVTRSGVVVAPLADFDTNTGRGIIRNFYSLDKGATWQQATVLDIADAGVQAYGIEDGLMEPTVTQRADGSLYMLLRTTQGYFWDASSNDDGRTWTDLRQTGIDASNSPGYLITLADGDLALLWNRMTPEFEDDWEMFKRDDPNYSAIPSSYFREEVSLAFSSDGGLTWGDPFVVAANPGGANLQYSRMFERHPNEIWMRIGGQWLSYQVPEPAAVATLLACGGTLLAQRRR